ncbi:MAG: hypothetical protein WCI91_04095 [Candidatus Nomurabacteria bacterium]
MKKIKNNKALKIIFIIVLCGFALIGLAFSGVFVAMRLHLTDVKGSIDSRNEFFNKVKKEGVRLPTIKKTSANLNFNRLDPSIECKIMTISSVLPENGQRILDTYMTTKSQVITLKMIDAIMLVTENNNPFLKEQMDKCNNISNNNFSLGDNATAQSVFSWMSSTEWQTLRDALVKDKDVILQASKDSGVPARVIVSTVISEQFRFFTANRESFKRYLEPLKVLGNGTKFSYGVAGVKIETAKVIEQNLKDKTSPYYLGVNYEGILNYGDADPNTELMNRLTNNDNHYYSYMYTAVFLKQIMHQWEAAGFPINDRPEVLATLFNLGFNKSTPKENPEVGGSTITINDRDYTFGGLSYEFYYSGELSEIFPFEVQ